MCRGIHARLPERLVQRDRILPRKEEAASQEEDLPGEAYEEIVVAGEEQVEGTTRYNASHCKAIEALNKTVSMGVSRDPRKTYQSGWPP